MTILSGKARLAGIIGWPVEHSRSPRLHGFWLQRHGIDGVYVPLGIRPDRFNVAVRGLAAAGFAGANVTAPHKLAAFEICDTVEESARRAGAVNTLVFRDGRITGRNTDGIGFIANLRAHGVDLPGLSVIDWPARSAALADHVLLVNTTSLGMAGYPPLELDLDRAHAGMAVADIVYVPLETPLLAAARARGLRQVEGLGMLLHQAVPGFAAWFGATPVVDDELRRFVAADLLD